MTDVRERLNVALAGRYAIERELGAGGMATVYLAQDVRHDRKVALKVMRPELAAVIGGERFLAEIKTTANLQHPHILPLFDSGAADGFLFYVMPYIEGETLRDRLAREKQLGVDDAVRIAREVAEALECAHEQGVIHRDIKPENILLHRGHALVTDFGIALAVSRSEGGSRLTETGMSLGTPHYMSPEQAMGEREITPKSDVYALGCVLYEMLAGEPPFTGPTAQAVVAKVMTQKPGSIVARRDRVPLHLEEAVFRALEKVPADRFVTAAQFAAALTGPSPDELPSRLTARGAPAPAPGRRAPRRALLLAAGAALVVVLGVGALLVTHRTQNGSGRPRIVVLPPLNLGPADQAYVADGIAEEVNNRLVSVPGIEVIGRTSAERYRQTTLTPKQIGEQLSADYILALRIGSEGPAAGHGIRVNAELVRARTEAQVWGKSFRADSTDDYFRVQGEIAEQVAEEMGVTLGAGDRSKLAARPTTNAEAYDLYLRAGIALRRSHSLADYRDAQALLERVVALDSSFAIAWAALAEAHTEQYWFWGDRSQRRLDLAAAAAKRATALAPDAPETHFAMGLYYYHAHLDFPHALEQLRAALAADPGQARFYEYQAYVQRRAGRFDDALVSLRRATQLDPQAEPVVSGVGELLVGMGRPAEAKPMVDRAVELAPEDWVAHYSAVAASVELGDLTGAADAAQRAIERIGLPRLLAERPRFLIGWARLLGPANRAVLLPFPPLAPTMPDTGGYYLARAQVEELLGRQARGSFDSAAAAYERRLRIQPDEPWDHAFLGQAYAGLGRRDDAVREGRRAEDLLPLSKDAWEGPLLISMLVGTYRRFGDQDAAVAEIARFITAEAGNRLLVRYDPVFAGFRNDPRVKRLIS
jgi:serine/threonine-protein kinase